MEERVQLNETYISPKLKERLLEIRSYPITAITAPSGYGKTTAIKWWDGHRQRRLRNSVLYWITVREDDLLGYWRDFCHLIGENVPSLGRLMESMGVPESGRTINLLIDAWRSTEPDPKRSIYIVLEDLHMLGRHGLTDQLAQVAEDLPPQVHLILISRNNIFKHAQVLKLGRSLLQIPKNIFQLDQEEITAYGRCCGIDIPAQTAHHLADFSGGWISLIYLIFQVYARTGQWKFNNRDIENLVEEVILSPLNQRCRDFLVQCSVTAEFTLEEAEYLWQQPDAAEMLRHLAEENAFITRSSDGKYRCHHLLLQNIRRHFAALPQETRRQCWRRLGDWSVAQRQYFPAMSAYRKAECWEEFLHVVALDQGVSMGGAQAAIIGEWRRSCPREILSRHPEAILTFAIQCFSAGEIPQMLELNAFLLDSVARSPDLSQEERDNYAGESEILMSLMEFNDIRAMSQRQRRACGLMSRESHFISRKSAWLFGAPSAVMLYHRQSGQLDDENRAMQECMPYYYQLTGGHGNGAEHAMLTETELMRGGFTNARIEYHLAYHAAMRKKQVNVLIAAEFAAMRLDLFEGNLAAARQRLEGLRQSIREEETFILMPTVDLCQAWLATMLGRPELIPAWITEPNAAQTLMAVVAASFWTIYNQVMLAQGDYAQAAACAARTLELCRDNHRALGMLYAQIHLAVAYDQLGKSGEAMELLHQALDMAVPDRLRLPFAESGRLVRPILVKLKKNGIYPTEIDRILYLIDELDKGCKQIMETSFGQCPDYGLSDREMEIARMAAQRRTTNEIAQALELSPNTVKNHLKRVFEKLDIPGNVRNKREKLEEKFHNN